MSKKTPAKELRDLLAVKPDWQRKCEVCDMTPVLPATGLCGPCTFGEADTVAGGWWDDEDEQRLIELRAAVDREDT